MFAKIILTQSSKAIDMAFTYKVPENMTESIAVGNKVIVPFGQGNRLVEGFVLSLEAQTDYKRIKQIHQIISDFALTPQQIEMISWLRTTYLCTFAEAITVVVPTGTKLIKTVQYEWLGKKEALDEALRNYFIEGPVEEQAISTPHHLRQIKALVKEKKMVKHVYFHSEVKTLYKRVAIAKVRPEHLVQALGRLKKSASKQRKVLEFLVNVSVCDVALLNRELKCNKTVLDKLIELDFIEIVDEAKYRRPEQLSSAVENQHYALNDAQQKVYDRIAGHLNTHQKYLLHGVTGSGKTEVYMTLAEKVIKAGQQVIILVPEIALTPQIVSKFLKRFGQKIAVIHSKVSQGERFDQYNAIASGQVNIIIGARSAVFSPCQNLGLVIMDEEHENTYKSESNPKYLTHEVAAYLTERAGVPLLIASATPDVKSYFQTERDYELLELTERFNAFDLPSVHLVDMREELKSGNKSMFSELLLEMMTAALDRQEQIILFYNRKGFATFVSCRSCGHALKCPRCDIALTYHHKNNEAKCSYCDYKIKVPKTCPECDSTYFKFFGAGTERVETMLRDHFPEARIGRLDSESTSKKGALEKIIDAVEQQEIDILLGTQMVTKGLDFKNVTLVGALSADMSLNLPDYRAPEKTFQLLTQVAGRAGRGDKAGEVVIQTYSPEHYAIQAAVDHDYNGFMAHELALREAFQYPPYIDMIRIMVTGQNDDHTIRSIHNLHQELERFIYKRIQPEAIEILGPNPAVFQKLNNKYRWQIILKFDKIDLVMLRNIIHYVCITHRDKVVMNDVFINIDIHPQNLM